MRRVPSARAPTASLSAATDWRRPRTSSQLLTYLLGTWSVSKNLQYTRGGKSGTFAGEATFARLNGDASIVSFVEEGTARLEPSGDTYDARQRLLYTADGSTDGVRVYFDEHIGARDDTSSVVKGARFFHDIQFDDAIDLGPFLHPCGPDMYRGKLAFDGESKFRLLWSVSGPRKLGVVTSTFCRLCS